MRKTLLGVSAFLLTFAVPAREWRDFNDEIARISAAGGGRVTVPAGAWETGPTHLRSNVELHLEGANRANRIRPDCHSRFSLA